MILIAIRESLQVWSLAVIATILVILAVAFPPVWGLTIPIVLLLILNIWEFVTVTMPLAREKSRYEPKHGKS